MLVLRLHAVAVHLLAKRHAILRVAMIAMLALEGLRLHPSLSVLPLGLHLHATLSVLALGLHLESLRMLLLPLHCKALSAHGVAATSATSKHLRVTASAATAAGEHLSLAAPVVAAATAASGDHLGMAATATATAVLLSLLVALAAAVRPRASRGCDRERGYAGCEKHPGHE
jgi:hypothetical protein